MNTDKITYFITHPESVDKTDLYSIIELKNKFPYSSTLHTLYLKTLANSNSLVFEEELKKSAIQVNDRERLHGIIHLTKQVDVKPEVIDVKLPSIEIPVVKTEVEQLVTPVEPKIIEIETPVEIKNQQLTQPTVKVVTKPIELKKLSHTIKSKPEQGKPDMAKIIEDIRLKAEASRNKQQIKEKESQQKSKVDTEVKIEPTSIELNDSLEKINDTIEVEKIAPIPNQQTIIALPEEKEETPLKVIQSEFIDETESVIEIEEVTIIQNSPQEEKSEIDSTSNKGTNDITETSSSINKKDGVDIDIMAQAMEVAFELDVDNIIREVNPPKEIEKEVIVEKISNEIPAIVTPVKIDELSFTDWLKVKQGKLKIDTTTTEKVNPPEKIKLTKNEVNSLLDKFITEEPKMARPQKNFFSPAKNAKKSLDEGEVLVSETLAKIYWIQKNYDKAIKAYEQLSLRNPDKSAIFANQIKKIKQELNQK
jgi:hypothetical protein